MSTTDEIRQRCLERLSLPDDFTDNDLAYELDRLKEIEDAATALLTAATSGPDDQDISEFLQLLFKLSAALNTSDIAN